MRVDRLTTKSQEALREAIDLASRRGNPELYPEHLLLALLTQEEGASPAVLAEMGLDVAALQKEIEKRVEGFPRVPEAQNLVCRVARWRC